MFVAAQLMRQEKNFSELPIEPIGCHGRPLPEDLRPECGAKTKAGEPCQAPVVPGKRRCRGHGGLSTGPKSNEGRERIREAQRLRWKGFHTEYRAADCI